MSRQFSVDCEARRSFRNPFEILWRDLKACEEGRRVCWKELRTLGTSGEEIKEPRKWNSSVLLGVRK